MADELIEENSNWLYVIRKTQKAAGKSIAKFRSQRGLMT
jgi:hypothetical protein